MTCPENPTVTRGATLQFTPPAPNSDGSTADLTSSATWSSSDAGVATVSSGGLATAVTSGVSTVWVTQGSVSDSTTLTAGGSGAGTPLTKEQCATKDGDSSPARRSVTKGKVQASWQVVGIDGGLAGARTKRASESKGCGSSQVTTRRPE
jgi:hypothetical protein